MPKVFDRTARVINSNLEGNPDAWDPATMGAASTTRDSESGAVGMNFGIHYGQNGGKWETDAANAREQAALGRAPVSIDYRNANTSLGNAAMLSAADYGYQNQQRQGMSMLGDAAAGRTASVAGIGAQIGSAAAYQQALQGMAAGRTSLGQAALTNQSLMAGSQGQLANASQYGGNRLNELASANAAYAGAGGTYNDSNLAMSKGLGAIGSLQGNMVTQQGQQNMTQAQLNQAYAMDQERQKLAINQTMQQGELSTFARYYGDADAQRAIHNQDLDRTLQWLGAGTSGAGSLMAGASRQTSDERAKEPAWDVLPLYNPEGLQLRQSEGGRGYYDVEASPQETIGGGMARPSLAAAAMESVKPRTDASSAPAKRRELTPDEMMAMANAMQKEQTAMSERSLAQGPSVRESKNVDSGVLADANRKMAGQPYQYRPEFTPPDEVPGQIHHGFMAQNLEQNPVTATAVETDANGVKQVHQPRMMQAMASGIADLQRQLDETRLVMKGGR